MSYYDKISYGFPVTRACIGSTDKDKATIHVEYLGE